jgi:hypothetical protein
MRTDFAAPAARIIEARTPPVPIMHLAKHRIQNFPDHVVLVRIPSDADHRSEAMAIAIPN